ncbi:MAG: Recombination enhancement, RecA-dependent nuclease [Gammaproteobacteria bacterium]|nr:Recombination enhancement, RecA-dependent nuclease [Gammaproteobacteria bacterium]
MNRMEELRCERMMRLGCMACAYLEIIHPAQECHHLLDGGRRMGDWFTLSLCRGHHQGDWSAEQMILIPHEKRIAISDGRKAFCRIYPTERELWELVQERLGLAWPPSKIVPRIQQSTVGNTV